MLLCIKNLRNIILLIVLKKNKKKCLIYFQKKKRESETIQDKNIINYRMVFMFYIIDKFCCGCGCGWCGIYENLSYIRRPLSIIDVKLVLDT